ncbi:hypothetical protein OH717_33940 (plasmid) [Streptomyces albidoflavus]|uniref:hypothetical protein n=1 Tax=Streptomyces albidoflavus TaxID=1886 RepID=UPI002F9070BC|nr:hypothetical protein OH717_34110 [Streptomyces albidoflavus]WTD07603.1 hypothetical protein OH717_33940 [Streptomyces albidoflavus]
MRHLISTIALALAAATLPAAPAGAVPAPAECATRWTVTGGKVAIRRPASNATSATATSPVVRYLHRGDRITSCWQTHNRNGSNSYRKCGKAGQNWLIIRGPRGGQIPLTCVRR